MCWSAGGALERMEGNISSILQHNTACISALHVLKARMRCCGMDDRRSEYPRWQDPGSSPRCHDPTRPRPRIVSCRPVASSLGQMSARGLARIQSPLVRQVYAQRLGCDLNRPAAVSRTLGDAFLLVSEALADPGLLQFPPSVAAAAVLVAARKAQVRAVAANPTPEPNLNSNPSPHADPKSQLQL